MDPQLHAMNGAKTSSSFTVKDILDLPKGKSSCSPVDSTTNTVNAASLSSIPSVPEVPDITSVGGYYDADNPYTRWLHNNENMYSRKLFFHQNSFNSIFLLTIMIESGCFWLVQNKIKQKLSHWQIL